MQGRIREATFCPCWRINEARLALAVHKFPATGGARPRHQRRCQLPAARRSRVVCWERRRPGAGARGCVSAVLFGDGETLKREQAAWANAVAVRESTRLLPC